MDEQPTCTQKSLQSSMTKEKNKYRHSGLYVQSNGSKILSQGFIREIEHFDDERENKKRGR